MKEYKGELFELMLKHASKELLDEMITKYPSPEELKDKYEFSSKFKKWIDEIIENERKRLKHKKFKNIKNKFMNIGKRIAIAMYIIIATFSVVAFTVPSIRVALLNFYIERHDEYISFDLQGQGEEYNNELDDNQSDIILYIPEGFEIKNTIENETALFITYKNNNILIHFERYVGKVSITLDGEDSNFEIVIIGNKEIYTSSKNGMNTIIFNDADFGYKLSSDISMEELKKMVESILK